MCYERSKELFLAILRFFSRALEEAMNVVKRNTKAEGDVVLRSFTIYQGGRDMDNSEWGGAAAATELDIFLRERERRF